MRAAAAAAPAPATPEPDWRALYLRAQRRFERERAVRLEVEAIAERGLRDLHERERQQALLEAVARHANGTSSEEDALGFALAEVCGHAGWAFGCVYRPAAADPTRLVQWGIVHVAGAGLDAFRAATAGAEFPPAVGLPGRVRASCRAHWLPDVTVDAGFQRRAAALACGLRAGVAFPILVAGEVVAVVEFFAREVLAPDSAFLAVLAGIGTQLGRVVERARAARRLVHDATHDPLTGLPNRALFLDRLDASLARGAGGAVLFIDLDRFKLVNDSLGHAAGDALLVAIAGRLAAATAAAGARHVLARLGGDEFTVLLDGAAAAASAPAFAEGLLDALAAPIAVEGATLHATASVGIVAVEPGRAGGGARDLMRDADLAMYRAKTAGRARVAVFDEGLHRAAVRRLELESDLRAGLRDGAFVLHYQPIVSLRDRRTAGFEALVRWRRTPGALVYPGDFIAVAEESGLIEPLGFWVMAEACRAAVRWAAAGAGGGRPWVSVNLSPRQFRCDDLVARVRTILSDSGAEPGLLKIEITESVAMENTERAASVLRSLRELGVGISIDDFGTGYSSLASLHRLPFDTLKIDRSFVAAMERDGDGILRTVVGLARSLGLGVVAEGAETAAQVEALAALGCGHAQGFHFSRPVPEDAVAALLSP